MKSIDSLVKVEKQRPAAAFYPLAEVFGEPKRLEKNDSPFSLKFGFLKIVVLILIVGLNWSGLLTIGRTLGFFSDEERSAENSIFAAALNFSILAGADFSPEVLPELETTRNVSLQSDGTLDFVYRITTQDAVGPLCAVLELKDNVNDSFLPLNSFISTSTLFSQNTNLDLTGRLVSNDASFQNQACGFKLAVEGRQQNLPFGDGFGDREEIDATIISGEWTIEEPPLALSPIVINEFMPNSLGGDNEAFGEWVELYNNSDSPYNVAGWFLYDNNDQHDLEITSCHTNTGNTIIAGYGFLVVYRKTGPGCTSNFQLNNSGDTVRLFDGPIGSGNLIDSFTYTSSIPGKTYARVPDGSNNWVDPNPTPGAPNVLEWTPVVEGNDHDNEDDHDNNNNNDNEDDAAEELPEPSDPEIAEPDQPLIEPEPAALPENSPVVSDTLPQDDEPDGDSGEADLEIPDADQPQ